jgi:elongation factor 1 alpha-like protein
MSRHKLVKNLDLDAELDDFDGGDDYGYDEDVAADGGMAALAFPFIAYT